VRMGDFLGKFCVLLRRTCLFLRESTVRPQRPEDFSALGSAVWSRDESRRDGSRSLRQAGKAGAGFGEHAVPEHSERDGSRV